jgi:hypothetical protein
MDAPCTVSPQGYHVSVLLMLFSMMALPVGTTVNVTAVNVNKMGLVRSWDL